MRPSDRELVAAVPIQEISRTLVREWAMIVVTALAALPAPVLRVLDVTGLADPGLPDPVNAVIFGAGIFAAATLLTWASEVAETEVSAGLALVALALIAVLPEYAVDLYFAWTAHSTPEHAHFAVANMTGGNRLLVGLAWPAIFLVFYLRTRRKDMPVIAGNAPGILFLGIATLYSFTIPLRGHLSLLDTAVMFSLFAAYMYISSRTPPEEERVFVGPAAAIAALARLPRRALVISIFVYAATVIFAAAEPFANSLVDTGKSAGIDQFVLVQWVAPLASESPEFILAGLLALRGRHDAGMTILISSKVNQWTLLIGSLPLAYSISGGTFSPLGFDARQSDEVFLTAAQSLFAVAILVSLSMGRWEAALLGALFLTQFFFTDREIRLAFAIVYSALAVIVLALDVPKLPAFARAVRTTVFPAAGVRPH
ncbi:MAG: sodium:calcium antiporter [Chloroflexi bacterium]|nr:MAG: sodium:calcium antiporter [Chloroflexota bacterium]